MDRDRLDVVLETWKLYQGLATSFGDNCWKIKTLGIGFWSAVVAYGYQNGDRIVYFYSGILILLFFIIESGIRRIQYKYIQKSVEIEKVLNDFLVEEEEIDYPDNGISTNIDIPDLNDFKDLFRLKSWMFWLPYLILMGCSIILYTFNL